MAGTPGFVGLSAEAIGKIVDAITPDFLLGHQWHGRLALARGCAVYERIFETLPGEERGC
jgi:hypothetical protein